MPLESRTQQAAALAGILVLTLAAYASTLFSSFHFDDFAIFSDPVLTSSDGWWRVFRFDQTRPLTYFTFWLNYRVGGTDPWGYHALNLATHLGCVMVAWFVFRRLAEPVIALAATTVFALHPLQSQAVAYVFERATLVATFFCLLAWGDWLAGKRWRAVAWFALALLAKEEAVAFPVFVLAVDWALGRLKRAAWTPLAFWFGLSLAAGGRLLFVAAHTKGAGVGRAGSASAWEYLLTQPKVICQYFSKFVLPIGQNLDHDVQPFSGWDATSLAFMMTLLTLIILAVWQRSRWGIWVIGALILLAPSSSIIPLEDLMFEHRMYLPLISLSLAAASALAGLPARWRPAFLAVLAVVLSGVTWARARVWSTEETLWTDAVARSPGKLRPKLQLARSIAATDPERARRLLAAAQQLDPRNPEPFAQMGSLLLDQNNPGAALEQFDQALQRAPGSADAHSNRGTALYLLGHLPEAEAEFSRAVDLDPCHYNARHNLSLLYRARGDEVALRRVAEIPSNCRFTPAQLADLDEK